MGRISQPRTKIEEIATASLAGEDIPAEDLAMLANLSSKVNLGLSEISPKLDTSPGAGAEVVLVDGARELRGEGPATRCDLCGHVFGLELMVKFESKYYCTVHECAAEVITNSGHPIRRDNPNWIDWDEINKYFLLVTETDETLEADGGTLVIDRFGAGEVERGLR
jgi:hypothetical protein